MIHVPPPYDGPTPPALLRWLAHHARDAAFALTSSPAFADRWWDAEHRAFGRSPHAEAASGWAGVDGVIRHVNGMAMGGS